MKILRNYQTDLSQKGVEILRRRKIVYLAMEVRTGKTATALEIAKLYGAKSVLFLTKKKAISSIESDVKEFGYTFKLEVTNNESLHKVEGDFDLLISDENHRNGAYPKPNQVTKLIKERFSHLPMIFLSGTPTPESYSQIYHQFWVSKYSPFNDYSNFYKWAKDFVKVVQKKLPHGLVNNYDNANQKLIKEFIGDRMISFTQAEAGFTSSVNEHILYCSMSDRTYALINQLKRTNIIEGKNEVVLADTAVKLMSKLHQMCSGTVKFESGNSMVIDHSKAEYIQDYFKNEKIAIFYKFKEELQMLKDVFKDQLCTDLETFNATDKNIALQIISGREGISLRAAKYLVYVNIDFSSVSYWQSRDRLTEKDRPSNDVYWVFSKNGIEEKIYKSVLNKKDYTLSQFRKDVGAANTIKNYQTA